MAYTPELSQRQSAILRRLAWAMDKPMTKALHELVELMAEKADSALICAKCRDTSACGDCAFNKGGDE